MITWKIVLMAFLFGTCLEITQQSVKDLLVRIMVFPLREVTNVSLATDARGPCLFGCQDRVIQTDGEKRFLLLLFLFFQSRSNFKFDPCAFNRVLRKISSNLSYRRMPSSMPRTITVPGRILWGANQHRTPLLCKSAYNRLANSSSLLE